MRGENDLTNLYFLSTIPLKLSGNEKSGKNDNIIGLDAEISVIEPMGHETVVICESNYGELTGKVDSNSKLKENMTVKINVSLEKVYFFDKKSEKNLNL